MIDLHMHTVYSDGTYTVREILEEAQRLGLTSISITDHNSVSAYLDLNDPKIRSIFHGEIIYGCEITTTYNGETIEILGYDFNIDTMRKLLEENVLTTEQKQIKEYELILKRFKEIGVKFDENNVIFDPKKGSSRAAFLNEINKYEENYKFFLDEKSLHDRNSFARNEIYNPKSPLYVDESSLFPSLEKTISIIHESGGLAFLAHTYAYSPTIAEKLEDIISNYEIDGLECYYTTFSKEQTTHLLDFCNKHNLYKSGGTDFHGTNKVNHYMGIGSGNMSIDEDLIGEWHSLIKKI